MILYRPMKWHCSHNLCDSSDGPTGGGSIGLGGGPTPLNIGHSIVV
jgi:hypothetical protein